MVVDIKHTKELKILISKEYRNLSSIVSDFVEEISKGDPEMDYKKHVSKLSDSLDSLVGILSESKFKKDAIDISYSVFDVSVGEVLEKYPDDVQKTAQMLLDFTAVMWEPNENKQSKDAESNLRFKVKKKNPLVLINGDKDDKPKGWDR